MNKKYITTGIEIVGLFGSVARDENRDDSDIDILYKTKQGIENLYDKKLTLKEELQTLFKAKVDLANEKYLKPYAKSSIMKDLVYV
ncbi:MAG: nucleotidyltransferase domain-containing protein [Campylobacterota bacterium]|nr:nucleotidyltransferase domain-containing protein [Campylobacterota bacterium]